MLPFLLTQFTIHFVSKTWSKHPGDPIYLYDEVQLSNLIKPFKVFHCIIFSSPTRVLLRLCLFHLAGLFVPINWQCLSGLQAPASALYPLLCLSKSKVEFNVKLRCHFFSGSNFPSYCRSVTLKYLHFPISWRLICKLFHLTYNMAPISLSRLISTNFYVLDLQTQWITDSQSCHVYPAFCTFVHAFPTARYDLPFSPLEKISTILQDPL